MWLRFDVVWQCLLHRNVAAVINKPLCSMHNKLSNGGASLQDPSLHHPPGHCDVHITAGPACRLLRLVLYKCAGLRGVVAVASPSHTTPHLGRFVGMLP